MDRKSTFLYFSLNLLIKFFWNCTWYKGIKEKVKVTVLVLQGKFLKSPKLEKWVSFGSKINIIEHFSKSFYYVFLELYLITDIRKWTKVAVLDFEGKFILYSKCDKSATYYNQGSIVTLHLFILCYMFQYNAILIGSSRVHISYIWIFKYIFVKNNR